MSSSNPSSCQDFFTFLLYFQVVYVIEHDFSNAYIQEHLQLAFDNVQVVKVENPSSDELTKKRMRKKKLVRTGEQVMILSFSRLNTNW